MQISLFYYLEHKILIYKKLSGFFEIHVCCCEIDYVIHSFVLKQTPNNMIVNVRLISNDNCLGDFSKYIHCTYVGFF